jgi:hypothetical protein
MLEVTENFISQLPKLVYSKWLKLIGWQENMTVDVQKRPKLSRLRSCRSI